MKKIRLLVIAYLSLIIVLGFPFTISDESDYGGSIIEISVQPVIPTIQMKIIDR